MTVTDTLDTDDAFARYEAIRDRLPQADFPQTSRRAETLADAAADYDGFVLDAFGVLNVGDTAIAGAVARMADLRAAGKALCVLTNSASYTRAEALAIALQIVTGYFGFTSGQASERWLLWLHRQR